MQDSPVLSSKRLACCNAVTYTGQGETRTRFLAGYPTKHPSGPDAGKAFEGIRWPDTPPVRESDVKVVKQSIRRISVGFYIYIGLCAIDVDNQKKLN